MHDRSRSFVVDSVTAGYERHLLGPIFDPWAADLVGRAGLRSGATVLDVASGLGPVARRAATEVGSDGGVVAVDVSAAMLWRGATVPRAPGSAPVDRVVASADELPCRKHVFDAVLCQQGLQFFPDRRRAAAEMRRVLRPDGAAYVSVWALERDWGLFGPIVRALADAGLPEPYPEAFDPDARRFSKAAVAEVLADGGFRHVEVETAELDASWPTIEDAVATLSGTPFGPMVEALGPSTRREVEERLAAALGQEPDGRVVVRTSVNVAIGRRTPGD